MIHEDAKHDSRIIKERQMDRNNPKFFKDQPSDSYSNVTSFGGTSSQQTISESYSDDDNRLYNAMDSQMKQFIENRQQNQQYVSQTPQQINK